MKAALFFSNHPIEAVTFGTEESINAITFEIPIVADGTKLYSAEISQQFIGKNVPESLSLKDLSEYGLDSAVLHHVSEAEENSHFTISNVKKCLPKAIPSAEILPIEYESTPKNTTYPLFQKSLPPAQIHMPAPINKEIFQLAKKENEVQITGVQISRYLRAHYQVRIFQEKLYLFDEDRSIYKYFTEPALHRIIYRHFGKKIEDQDNVRAYYDAIEYLIKDIEIVVSEDFLLPKHFWGFQNGLFDVEQGQLYKNTGQYFIRHVLQCEYNPLAKCPNFEKFLTSISAGDPLLTELLWETIGYLLSFDTNGKIFFAFIGKKDTGKSLLANVLTKIVGEDAVSHLSAQEFSGRFDVAELNGKHLNLCMDLPDRPLSAEAVAKIKSITGGDKIRSDVKYKESISFVPTARLLFGSNSLIRPAYPDSAFAERMITIPFNYPVAKDKQDRQLLDKLLAEKEGICVKAMSYYLRLVQNSYQFTRVDTYSYECKTIDFSKVIRVFAETCCKFTGNDADKVSSNDLYMAFRNFCFSQDLPLIEHNDFSQRFREMFSEKTEKKKIKIDGLSVNGFVRLALASPK